MTKEEYIERVNEILLHETCNDKYTKHNIGGYSRIAVLDKIMGLFHKEKAHDKKAMPQMH